MYYLNQYGNNYWAWAQILTPETCAELITQFSSRELTLAGVGSGLKSSVNIEQRDSEICWLALDDSTLKLYEHIAEGVKIINEKFFQYDLDIIETLQFTRYTPDHPHFHKHLDIAIEDSKHRKLSFSIQLSDPSEYEGGELLLYTSEKPMIAHKEQGMINFFPSWMLHEVTPVTKGTRYCLVGWVRGPRFK